MLTRKLLLSALTSILLTGCYEIPGTFGTGANDDDRSGSDDDDSAAADQDADGWPEGEDCDDLNPQINPAAQELCNELDDDCDGLIDEEAAEDWFTDEDGDGYGLDSSLTESCEPPGAMVGQGGDCDDNDDSIFPVSPQQLDGLDSDCDGLRDWLVSIYVATDDAGELCIDGWENLLGETGGWSSGTMHEIWLSSGIHNIGIRGWDTGSVITATIAHLEISTGQQWFSDDSWRYDPNPTASDKSRRGWCEPHFNDSNWDLALDLGPIGSSPWQLSQGHAPAIFPADSPAHWIWDHIPTNLHTQYLRKEFTLP